MSETSGQIETHIRNTREDLSANLSELEQKVKSVTDWRHQFQKNPGTFLAVAAGGGMLLALLSRGGGSSGAASGAVGTPSSAPRNGSGQFNQTINEIKSALIGVAASQAKTMLAKFIPGFEEQMGGSSRPRPENLRPDGSAEWRSPQEPPIAH